MTKAFVRLSQIGRKGSYSKRESEAPAELSKSFSSAEPRTSARNRSPAIIRGRQRKGMALLVVVVLVMLISLGAYRFSFYMESQYRLTRLHEEQVHARLSAASGLELAAAIVEMSQAQRMSIGGLRDNAAALRDIAVGDSVTETLSTRNPNVWRFCLVSPAIAEDAKRNTLSSNPVAGTASLPIRFGLENESAKLHIPTLIAWDRLKPGHARSTLLGLPGVSESMIDGWMREFGVSTRVDRGVSQNQIASLDDLRHAWYGGDLNQNYQLDPIEIQLASRLLRRNGAASQQGIDSSRLVGPFKPLQRFVTWYSGHRNATRNGDPRIYLNDPNLQSLHRRLTMVWSADWANFVIAMRQFGPSIALALPIPTAGNPLTSTAPVSSIEMVQEWAPDFGKAPVFTFRSPLDLAGAVVDLPTMVTSSSPSNVPVSVKRTLRNPFSSDLSAVRNYLGRILDDVTVDVSPVSEGRIDVSDAPVEVLAGVPGLDMSLAQRIVQQRSGSLVTLSKSQELDTIAWLVDIVDLAKLKELEPYLTCRSDVYSVQAIGYRDNQSAVYRTTATIDAREYPTQLRNQKVWHPWDRGFPIEQLAESKP